MTPSPSKSQANSSPQFTSTPTHISIASTQDGDDTRYTMTTSEIVIHRVSSNFAFGEFNTFVRLEDEAGGPFLVIRQPDSSEKGELRLDPEEIELIAQAAKTLIAQPAALLAVKA